MIVAIAVERKGDGVGKKSKRWKLGRARTELVPDVTRETLLVFVERNRELASTIHTDRLEAYKEPAAVERARPALLPAAPERCRAAEDQSGGDRAAPEAGRDEQRGRKRTRPAPCERDHEHACTARDGSGGTGEVRQAEDSADIGSLGAAP